MDCFACENEHIQVHLTSAEEQDAVLSNLDDLDAIKALVPLTNDGPKTEHEQKLQEVLVGLGSNTPSSSGSLNDLDGGIARTSDTGLEQLASPELDITKKTPTYIDLFDSLYEFGSGRIVTLTLSCLAASVALGYIVGMLYVKYLLGRNERLLTLPSNNMPIETHRIQNRSAGNATYGAGDDGEKLGLLFLDMEAPQPGTVVVSNEDGNVNEKAALVDYSSSDDEFDDADEKLNAMDSLESLLDVHATSPNLPRIAVSHADPDLLPLPMHGIATPYSTPPNTPPRSSLRRLPSQLSMRETNASSPLSKPAWSLRAADAPALGLASSPSSPLMRAVSPESVSIPGAFIPDEESAVTERPVPRRAYRAPMPELDIAFAMQLRPGLGLGSDPAWFVRFLMAMFGWMTVLIGSNGTRRPNQRAIAV